MSKYESTFPDGTNSKEFIKKNPSEFNSAVKNRTPRGFKLLTSSLLKVLNMNYAENLTFSSSHLDLYLCFPSADILNDRKQKTRRYLYDFSGSPISRTPYLCINFVLFFIQIKKIFRISDISREKKNY